MEVSAFAFNVSGLEERCRFGFNSEQTNIEDDDAIDLTKYNILMLFDIRMNGDEVINKFPILQNYITREYVYTNNSDRKSSLLVKHLYGYKKELEKCCSFVTLGDQIVFKISNNRKNVRQTYIIPVYLEKSEWESNFEKLKDQLLSLKHKNVVLVGDYNARVGNAQFINEARENLNTSINGKRRSEDVFLDDFGKNLIPWSEENLLTLLNGRTSSDCEGRFTFGHKSTIDLCFVKGDLHKYVTDFQVIEKRWGSLHSPITVAASLNFVEHTTIPFSDILAAAIRPFEPYNEDQSETKSSELFEKYKQQMIKKLYFENQFKAFAKIEYKTEFWELAKRLDTCVFFGQNIKFETSLFVQKVEVLFKEVINEGLINFLPLQRDELLDKDLCIKDVFEINANIKPSYTGKSEKFTIPDDFYERAIESFNFNQVEIPAASYKSISYLVNFIYYKIMLRRTLEWAQENHILKEHSHENGVSCLDKLTTIGESYLINKKVLYVFTVCLHDTAVDSFLKNEAQMKALLFKLSFARMSTKFLKKLENFMRYYDEYRKSDVFFGMGTLRWTLSEILFGCFFVSLQDFLSEGKQWCKQYLCGDTYLIYAETPSIMRTMINQLELYFRIWGIKLNTKKSYIAIFKPTDKPTNRYYSDEYFEYEGTPIHTETF